MMDTKKLRQKILDLAIRGKLVPQDPNDEPASVLLERIRAEKERLIKEGKIKHSKKSTTNEEIEAPFKIPKGWCWCFLPDLCSIPITDGTHQTPTYSDKEHGIPFISSKDVTSQRINWNDIKFITKDLHESLYRRIAPQKNDILLAKNGTTGVAAMVEDDSVFDIYVTLAVIRPVEELVLPKYLWRIINSQFCKEQFDNHLTGIGLPNLHLTDIKKTIIPLPPLAEQQRIINEVERWFAVIDELESNEGDLLKAIDQAKSKIIDLAIHGKLVPQDPNDEPAIDLLKRINSKFEACENTLYKHVPQGWTVCTIKDIASSELGKTLDREKNKGNYRPYLCSINVFWNQFDLTEMKQMRFEDDELEHYSIHRNDLVICEGGDAGRCAVWPYNNSALFQNAIHRVRFKENIESYFYMYLLMYLKNNHLLDKYCKGVTIKHFTKTALLSLPVPLPPIQEQRRIVAKIEELFAILDSIKESLE